MTRQQADCLSFIQTFIAERGISPSYEEIGAHLGLTSKAEVFRLVHALVDHGKIKLLTNRARSIELVELPQHTALADRIIDRIAARNPQTRDGLRSAILEVLA